MIWKPIALGAVMSLVFGGVGAFISGSDLQGYSLLSSVLFVIPAIWWLQLDSSRFPNVPVGSLKVLIVLLGFIGLPIYLFRTRGFTRGLLAILGVVAVLVASNLIWEIGLGVVRLTQGYTLAAVLNAIRLF